MTSLLSEDQLDWRRYLTVVKEEHHNPQLIKELADLESEIESICSLDSGVLVHPAVLNSIIIFEVHIVDQIVWPGNDSLLKCFLYMNLCILSHTFSSEDFIADLRSFYVSEIFQAPAVKLEIFWAHNLRLLRMQESLLSDWYHVDDNI